MAIEVEVIEGIEIKEEIKRETEGAQDNTRAKGNWLTRLLGINK